MGEFLPYAAAAFLFYAFAVIWVTGDYWLMLTGMGVAAGLALFWLILTVLVS